jgi:hypothetical protein
MNATQNTIAACLALALSTSSYSRAGATNTQILFSDDFNRTESTEGREEIGNGWTSNSATRAKGNQQVFLRNGEMHVTKHQTADHGVAIFHDVAFENGSVELRFQLNPGDDLGVDFVDRELKTVHAGHLCMAKVTPKAVTLQDSKTGAMELKIQERRLAGDKSPELAALLKEKQKVLPIDLDTTKWHKLLVTIVGDTMTATLDDLEVGSFKSVGIAHPTKRMITLAVNKSAKVDDIKVCSILP